MRSTARRVAQHGLRGPSFIASFVVNPADESRNDRVGKAAGSQETRLLGTLGRRLRGMTLKFLLPHRFRPFPFGFP